MDKTIDTERLFIKNGTIRDFQKVYEYDFSKLENVAGEFEFVKQDKNYIKTWFNPNIKSYYEQLNQRNAFDFIIYLKDGTPIGNLMFDNINQLEKSIEISCNVHPDYWGNEYMVEAISATIPFIFSLGFNSLIYSYAEGNEKSKRICEKLGFELCKTKINNYRKNGIAITVYRNILSRQKYDNKESKPKVKY